MPEFVPIKIVGQCVETDEALFENMEAAIARGLPQIARPGEIREGVVAIVASGPSVHDHLDTIRNMKESGTPIMAVKDAHDWLIENGIVPDMAIAVDPQPHRWNCFTRARSDVKYMIASQCHPAMFDYLAGFDVTIWHLQMKHGQDRPKNAMLVGGGTTSGLRAISLLYVMGWRNFALFGFDSSLRGGQLRVNGTGLKEGDGIVEIRLDPINGPTFYTNASMALQAEHFQTYYDFLPDAHFIPFGEGLIPAIIRAREAQFERLQLAESKRCSTWNSISFIHKGNAMHASYRYRAAAPAASLGASLNDLSADILVFCKPQADELMEMAEARARGARVIVDFCDDHFEWMHYREALLIAEIITCPTEAMAQRIKEICGKDAHVIPEAYQYPEAAPHCNGTSLLWFGYWHNDNKEAMERVGPTIEMYDLRMVSNGGMGFIPWTPGVMPREFACSDIVILPATSPLKSANRAIEAIRQGCFVVAEPHPSLVSIPGIWKGDIAQGVEWASKHLEEARARTWEAQRHVAERYSPRTVADAWRAAMRLPIISDVETSDGRDGSGLTSMEMQLNYDVTCANSQSIPIAPMR